MMPLNIMSDEEVASASGAPMITTWYTNSITLPLMTGYLYDFVVDWGDGTTDHITTYNQAERVHSYASTATWTVTITGLMQKFSLGNVTTSRTVFRTVEQLGDTGLTDTSNMFNGISYTGRNFIAGINNATLITSTYRMFMNYYSPVDVSNMDMSSCTTMQDMFNNARGLVTFNGFKIYANTNVQYMFSTAQGSIDLTGIDTTEMTTASNMFKNYSYTGALDVGHMNMMSCTTMQDMFNNNRAQLSFNGFKIYANTNVQYMFSTAYGSIDLTGIDTSEMTSAIDMFRNYYYTGALDVGHMNMASCTTMVEMFNNNKAQLTFNGFKIYANTNVQYMFSTAQGSIDLTGIDTSEMTTAYNMFRNYYYTGTLDLSPMNMSSCATMQEMLVNCRATIVGLETLNIGNVTTMYNMMNNASTKTLTTAQYDALLINYQAQPHKLNVPMYIKGTYTLGGAAETARNALIADGWTITDNGGI